jgi:signal transduction histidine kinase/CheY-like chemotaxis protein
MEAARMTLRPTLFRRLLLGFIGIALLPLLAVSFVIQRNAERYLRDAAMRQLRATASAKARLLTMYEREREQDLFTLTHHPLLAACLRGHHGGAATVDADAYLRVVTESYGYREITVLSTTGTVVLTTSPLLAPGANIDRVRQEVPGLASAFEQARTLLELTRDDVFDDAGRLRASYMAAPAIDRETLLGIIITKIDNTPVLAAVNSRAANTDTEEVLLAAQRGSRTFFTDGRRGKPSRAAINASAGYQGEGEVTDYRGKRTLAVWRYLPTVGWGMVVKIDAAEALAPVVQLKVITVSSSVGAILLVAFFAVITSRAVARPIVMLRQAAARIADGDFSRHVPVTNDDETGQLAAAFNFMMERLERWTDVVRAKERLEAEIRERAAIDSVKAQLEQAERLAALGRVASKIAHEFNNVLMSIQVFNEVQRRSGSASSTDEIRRVVQRGKTITDAVLRLTRASKPHMGAVEAASFFATVAADLRPLLPRDVTLSIDCPCEGAFVRGDANHLQQVFTNLVLNACDAMPSGGGHVEISARVDGEVLCVSVRDNGLGMKPEVAAKAFEPLFTTKSNGTGLGLAITHEIIRAHGGSIALESVPEGGTTFDIVLPLAEAAGTEAADAAPLTLERNYRLLLVEDDQTVADGLVVLLRLLGMEVVHVATGAAALKELESWSGDAVILDVGLPDIDGVTVYHGIAERIPYMPVVFATGHADESKVAEVLQRPNVTFLRKPFDSGVLIPAIDAVTRAAAALPDEMRATA